MREDAMRQFVLIGVLISFWMSAPAAGAPKVRRTDPGEVTTLSTGFEATDLQDTAGAMVDSLLQASVLGNDRPVVTVAGIKNKTLEHIETKAITDKIRTALVRSGVVRFTANDARDDVRDENAFQESGAVDAATAKPSGHAIGADYTLVGEITEIETTAGRIKDVYYKMTLNLVDLKTQIIEWSDEKEIRKQAKRRVMGH
jgi:uncharacterized protein (TIGR02722 family)